jgi:hypothetical protein
VQAAGALSTKLPAWLRGNIEVDSWAEEGLDVTANANLARHSTGRRFCASTLRRIRSAARSATAITGALVFPRMTVGMTDASTEFRVASFATASLTPVAAHPPAPT